MTTQIRRLAWRRLFFVALLCGTLLVAGLVLTSRPSVESAAAWFGTVSVDGPSVIDAGADFAATVHSGAPDGTSAQLVVFAPVTTATFEAVSQDGVANFVVPAEITKHAGTLQLVGHVDERPSTSLSVTVRPGEAVEPVVPLVGPRTIIADGSDFTMSVISPTDPFGNPVVTGTEVVVDVLRANEDRTQLNDDVQGGIAAVIIESTTETGRVTVSSSVGRADGPSNSVDQVAGVPIEFTIEADSRNAIADGFTLHGIQTTVLQDQFGNLLPDGVAATFVIASQTDTTLVHSTVQGAIARTQFEAPATPGPVTITALVSGTGSLPLTVDFEPAVQDFPVRAKAADGRITFDVGPVITVRGGYVPDGTVVRVHDATSGEMLATSALRNGEASFELPRSSEPDAVYETTVLGSSVVVRDSELGE